MEFFSVVDTGEQSTGLKNIYLGNCILMVSELHKYMYSSRNLLKEPLGFDFYTCFTLLM